MTHLEVPLGAAGHTTTVPRRPPTRFDQFAAVVALTAFGLTWPVTQLLADNAEFFIARRSSTMEIVLLGVALLLVIPVALGGLASLPGKAGRLMAATLLAVSSTILFSLYLRTLPISVWISFVLSATIGGLVVWAFFRYTAARQVGRILLYGPLVMLAVVVFASPTGGLLGGQSVEPGEGVAIERPLPLLIMVMDEFPVASLIDTDGYLRTDRFPNFARMAADGTWYRNAVTVEQQTEHSVPAILTGDVPSQSLVPLAGQYPNSAFTALQGTYDLNVFENITQLCPIALCESLAVRRSPVARDVAVVAAQVLLPEPLTRGLPEISRTWGEFGVGSQDFDVVQEFRESLAADPRAPIDALLESIDDYDGSRPPFFFIHVLMPHHPWQYLPDGRRYPLVRERNPAAMSGGWIDDDFLVAQAMQRHLLQVGYADHVLGEIIDALEDAGLYEDAVVALVADHGISIKPGVSHQRKVTPTTVGEIAAVPLFIKVPGAGAGVIDDRRALTIDILPTVADAIGAQIPWQMDGSSLLGELPDRIETTTVGPDRRVTFGVDGSEKLEVAARLEMLFPDGDPWALRPEGTPDLRGALVDVDALEPAGFTIRLAQPQLYRDVDTSGVTIPSRVGGTLIGGVDGHEVLVVIVNGVVGALTRAYDFEDSISFLAMVPPDLFVDGENRVSVATLTKGGSLKRVAMT